MFMLHSFFPPKDFPGVRGIIMQAEFSFKNAPQIYAKNAHL